jgi:hypothetical protein
VDFLVGTLRLAFFEGGVFAVALVCDFIRSLLYELGPTFYGAISAPVSKIARMIVLSIDYGTASPAKRELGEQLTNLGLIFDRTRWRSQVSVQARREQQCGSGGDASGIAKSPNPKLIHYLLLPRIALPHRRNS